MENQIILITGANTGIGLAAAKKFLSHGKCVVINYIKDEQLIDELISSLKSEFHENIIAIKADITKASDRQFLISSVIKQFNGIDVLINNAAITNYEFNFPEISLDGFRDTIAVNLEAPIFLSKLFAEHLIKKKQSGCIVNISSVAGHRGCENIHYGASKAALMNITKTMAKKLAKYNIRVNSVSPGFVLTELSQEWKKNNLKAWNRILKEIPMGCAAKPETVAEAIYFLASKEADMITGVDLPVDGGFLS